MGRRDTQREREREKMQHKDRKGGGRKTHTERWKQRQTHKQRGSDSDQCMRAERRRDPLALSGSVVFFPPEWALSEGADIGRNGLGGDWVDFRPLGMGSSSGGCVCPREGKKAEQL